MAALRAVPAVLLLAAVAGGAVRPDGASAGAGGLVPGDRARESAATLPPGSTQMRIENIEGLLLLEARAIGPARDTTGLFALDTGAGYLGLGFAVASRLGVLEPGTRPAGIAIADHPVDRLEIGSLQLDQVKPVIALDLDIVRRVSDRAVLGLLGQGVFTNRLVWVDPRGERVIILPASPGRDGEDRPGTSRDPRLQSRRSDGPEVPDAATVEGSRRDLVGLLSRHAAAVPFRLAGDGKALLTVRIATSGGRDARVPLTLVLDTGATKCVLFETALDEAVPVARQWKSLDGLIAPTLIGTSEARMALVPAMELEAVAGGVGGATHRNPRRRDVDCAIVESELAGALSRAVGEPVHGLLGYSFLEAYRLGIDYGRNLLWLDPYPDGPARRPYEYSHVGLQLERDGDAVRVVSVASGSPADRAGIAPGDEVVSIAGRDVAGRDLTEVSHSLEGPPGSRVRLVIRRGGVETGHRLTRQRLL